MSTSILAGWTLYRTLTMEYRGQGIACGKGIADSRADFRVDRDVATVQALSDQSDETDGVGYVFVSDARGEVVAHTSVPAVPTEVLALNKTTKTSPVTGDAVTT